MDTTISISAVAEAVREGLSARQKSLPPWLFYDAAGSALFERITELPKYYLTRMELALLEEHAASVLEFSSEATALTMVELGAGSARKTAHLLRAALASHETVKYVPVDISAEALKSAVEFLEVELPQLKVRSVTGDFTQVDPRFDYGQGEDRTMLLWLGSSAGNFDPQETIRILQNASACLCEGDFLLLGLDLAPVEGGKSTAALEAAYDDDAGVTAAFNRNLLVRLNRELGADFDPTMFRHSAHWNPTASRMEMHLVSEAEQRVNIDALGRRFFFASGESLHTENSYKFSLLQAGEVLDEAGFPLVASWLDPEQWYGMFLGRKSC